MYIDGYIRGQPDVGWWLAQIRKAIAFRKKYAYEDRWQTWRNYYRGQWPRGTLPVNLFYRMLRSAIPRIYFNDPAISVVPARAGGDQQILAKIVERIDNRLIRVLGVKDQIKRAIHNAWMFGTGAVKVGWGSEFKPAPSHFSSEQAPIETSGSFSRKVEYNSLVFPDMPWLLSLHPSDLLVPSGTRSFEDVPWVGTWVRRPYDDVCSDPRLKNTSDLHVSSSSSFSDPVVETVDLVEIRDRRTEKVIVLAPYLSNKVLYYGDDTLHTNNRPNIYPIIFNVDDEVFWGVPDSIILEPQQLELNEIRTLMMQHRRLSIVKILAKTNSVRTSEMEKILNGDVAAVVNIDGELSDVTHFQTANIPSDLFLAANEVIQDVRETLGFSRNQWGDFAAQKSHSAPTAYETRVVQQAAEIRIEERRDIVADALVKAFEDINVLVFNKWTKEQVLQIIGPRGLPIWIAFRPSMLASSRYILTIDPDTSMPETRELRTQRALITYERLKTNPLIDPELLTQYLLHELHGVQFDDMMRTLQRNAAAGVPGSSPEHPMSVQDAVLEFSKHGVAG